MSSKSKPTSSKRESQSVSAPSGAKVSAGKASKQPAVSLPKSAATVEDSDEESDDEEDEDEEDGDDDSESESESESEREESDDSEDLDSRQPQAIRPRAITNSSRPMSFNSYDPPAGMSPLPVDASFSTSPFDFDALAAKPGVELWVIRAPADFKASRLSHLDLSPSLASGSITTKTHRFQVRAVPSSSAAGPSTTPAGSSADDVARAAGKEHAAGGLVESVEMPEHGVDESGGDEMSGLKLMVPNSKSGKLFMAPKKIARQFILTPAPSPSASGSTPSILPTATASGSKPKREQPSHLLKFRNRAFGFDTPGPGASRLNGTTTDAEYIDKVDEVVGAQVQSEKKKEKKEKKDRKSGAGMEVSGEDAGEERKKHKKKHKEEEGVERSEKKRKHESAESPKKRKKSAAE